ALPALLAEGLQPDFAYIDGAHDFANVFIDAFYVDQLLPSGGIVGFNDAGWPEVHRVIRFLRNGGRYDEMKVGLKRNFRGRNPIYTMARVVLGRSREDRYFRKRSNLDPS